MFSHARGWSSCVALIGALAATTGCGSSSTTNLAAPTTARCALTLNTAAPVLASGGGAGSVDVGIARECSWTAKPDVSWITVSPVSGQGDSQVAYSVAANPLAVQRTGSIVVNERRLELTQRAACLFTLTPAQAAASANGARVTVNVRGPAECAWTAASPAPWIEVEGGATGSGAGTVTLEVAPNTGPERSAEVMIAGARFSVTQSAGGTTVPPVGPAPPPPPGPTPPTPESGACAFSLSANTQNVGGAGGNGTVRVSATAGCAWSASSGAPWLTITAGGTGTGAGDVQFSAAPNTSTAPRTGTLTIAGLVFSVSQASGAPSPTCSFVLSSTSQTVGAAGGAGSIDVSAADGCAWEATSNADWLTITTGSGAIGNGTVRYTASANSNSSPRSAVLTIAKQTVTVTQAAAAAPACTFSVAPTTVDAPAGGVTSSVALTTSASSCGWTASTGASWITLTSPSTGTGSASVTFTVANNTATTTRTGTVTLGGQTVTVTQAAAVATPTTISGDISALQGGCPAITFVVAGRTVRTTASTDFQGGSCASLANGRAVTVEGLQESDGSITATRVKKD